MSTPSNPIVPMIPTASISVVSLMGIPLQEWTYITAIAVGACQIAYTIYCFYRKIKDKTVEKD